MLFANLRRQVFSRRGPNHLVFLTLNQLYDDNWSQHTRFFVFIAYALILLINVRADVSSEARGLNVCLSFHLHPYFVYGSSEGSSESVHEHSLLADAISTKISCTRPSIFTACSEGQYSCADNIGCYSFGKKCDNITDCSDGSDEIGCGMYSLHLVNWKISKLTTGKHGPVARKPVFGVSDKVIFEPA